MNLVSIGYGNLVSSKKLVAVVSPDAAPIKRLVQQAKEAGKAVDATCGRRTRSVIVTDSDHIILTYLQTETLANRIAEENSIEDVIIMARATDRRQIKIAQRERVMVSFIVSYSPFRTSVSYISHGKPRLFQEVLYECLHL